ncbi:CBS domain-containing protein [Verticillium dahliae VdLs.17]|uniref:CBS domain-containing protein n=1 Tax=Verticillium dahliae (strain VdLs.17 / ATCC MYA-4575 / FGSC 10137) TaxID=498257 RepID=G2X172_VERDV|nr:CBS domain-containing protein [Verticillium dahliae VdLs.17]EGY22563.1 CBS domain-containing protein [Verticillium dahliae VdLs.17]
MSGNTLRGTPNRGQSRPGIPFANSPGPGSSSSIPRPVLETHPSTTASDSGAAPAGGAAGAASAVSASRQKQIKRDDVRFGFPPLLYSPIRLDMMDTDFYIKAIRRKMESDLSKKKHLSGRARHTRKAPPGTVLALKPSPALQIKPGTTVAEAAQLMAAKREDCVLVTDDDDRISGIFTAKDLAFRVVGAGMKPTHITIADIMTKNPLCARTDTSATDALDLMVRKGFRHLPVMDENQDISGILDITKCFYDAMEKLERAYSSSRRLYDALEGVQSELGSSQPQQIIQYVEALRSKMSGPTLESVLNGTPPTTVSVRTSVREAAQLMKENRTTAVLVQDQGAITGIFTSKDVVLRVIAVGLDPATCSVVRVMTPHPDFASMDMSIQAALRKMHDGHYLNLPVMNDGGEIVGMVDVLKLTYATLEQINTMATGDNEGPAWNKFWLSLDNESESMVSGEGSHHHTNLGSRIMSPDHTRERIGDSVAPGDSASHVGVESPPHSEFIPADIIAPQSPAELPFPFKFKAPSGRVHRLQVIASQGVAAMVANVVAKLGAEAEAIGGAPTTDDDGKISGGFALSYLDDEGDSVSITTDNDLLESILLARQGHREKVDLFVHDPEKPPVAVAPTPVEPVIPTPATSTASGLRERRKAHDDEDDEDEEEEDESPSRRSRRSRHAAPQQEQLIQGVPNDLLLPGAIVTLAVVIVGVFTISRITSR